MVLFATDDVHKGCDHQLRHHFDNHFWSEWFTCILLRQVAERLLKKVDHALFGLDHLDTVLVLFFIFVEDLSLFFELTIFTEVQW